MAALEKVRVGMPVFDVDGRWLGDVERRGVGRSLVRYGYFTKQHAVLDDGCIADVTDTQIHLRVTRRHLLQAYARSEDRPPFLTRADALTIA